MERDRLFDRSDAAALAARDRRVLWHPWTAADDPSASVVSPPVIDRAEHVWLYTRDGRRLLDGVGSWWVSTLGHNHPRVRAAIAEQLDRMPHVALAGLTHEPAIRLAEQLLRVAPGAGGSDERLARVFYSDNGSTAVEVAVRIAHQYWQQNGQPERRLFLALEGAYHGDTLGAVSLGGVPLFRSRVADLTFRTVHLPGVVDGGSGERAERAFSSLEALLRAHAHEVAGVVVEPLVLGAAGMLMYGAERLRRIRALCSELGLLLIADEVLTGFGRTGTLFACEQAEVVPDLLCLSKGLTGGFLPFAATLATERLWDGFRGAPSRMLFYGHSYTGNPLGCAAALAAIETIEEEQVLANVAARGAQMQQWLDRIAELPGVSGARRTGLIGAVQIGEGASYTERSGRRIAERAMELGLYLRPLGNVICLVPALTIREDELATLLDGTGRAIREAL